MKAGPRFCILLLLERYVLFISVIGSCMAQKFRPQEMNEDAYMWRDKGEDESRRLREIEPSSFPHTVWSVVETLVVDLARHLLFFFLSSIV
ncbi:hypothetical protein Bca4012_024619 [Brassica carinata]